MRARTGIAAAQVPLLLMALGSACEATNLGDPPPSDQFFFPAGVLIDPFYEAPPPDGLASDPPDLDAIVLPEPVPQVPGPRYLYVTNGNNDRTYNAGSVVAIDLDAFWRAWYEPYPDDALAGCLQRQTQAQAQADAVQGRLDAIAAQLLAGELTEDEAAAATAQVYDELRAAFSAAREACDPRRGRVDPYCEQGDGADGRCVLPPGSAITPQTPCRRLPLVPHVVECDEQPFVAAEVHVGDFATTLAASIETDDGGEEFARLWVPVRGDPSITYVDVRSQGDRISMECDQGEDPLDPDLCGDAHRLDQLRSDPDLQSLDREPFNALVWERAAPDPDPDTPGQRLAFVAHADGVQLSVVDLDGVRGGSEPAIVDLAPLYQVGTSGAGGFGLAARPCFEAGQGPLGDLDPEDNVPAVTQGCTRPLVYTSMRFSGQLISFTASGLDVGAEIEAIVPASSRTSCSISVNPGCDLADPTTCTADCGGSCVEQYAGPYCASPDQFGQPCAVECEAQVRGTRRLQLTSLLIDTSLTSAPILGDIAFADARGDQLLLLQTNPGALISLDTSLSVDGEPLDIPSAPPVEICAEPSRMKIYTERDGSGRPIQRYALITCFRAAEVFVVDLEALRVVEAIVVGTGPHDIAIDDAREVAYVINNLEFSISVVDLSRRRSTRFQEMARLGLQDPFSQ